MMNRLRMSEAEWERMAPLIIGRPDHKDSTGRNNRMLVEVVLWIVRTAHPGPRCLARGFQASSKRSGGPFVAQMAFRRFSRWSIKGVWRRIFEAMSDDPDFECLIVDFTVIRAHQHAAGAK